MLEGDQTWVELKEKKSKNYVPEHQIPEFQVHHTTFHMHAGFSLRIKVAGGRCNIPREYFERGFMSGGVQNSHKLPNICRRILHN